MSHCPACNGLISLTETCLHCGTLLSDAGSREDFYGPYKPYMSNDKCIDQICMHLLICEDCGSCVDWPVPVMR